MGQELRMGITKHVSALQGAPSGTGLRGDPIARAGLSEVSLYTRQSALLSARTQMCVSAEMTAPGLPVEPRPPPSTASSDFSHSSPDVGLLARQKPHCLS